MCEYWEIFRTFANERSSGHFRRSEQFGITKKKSLILRDFLDFNICLNRLLFSDNSTLAISSALIVDDIFLLIFVRFCTLGKIPTLAHARSPHAVKEL